MDVPLWVWALTVGAILLMLTVDLVGHVRTPHAPTLRESATWSAAYVAIGLLFGLVVLAGWGGEYSLQYYSGFLLEKSLSIDNLFVFVLIMSSFAVPRIYQQKVLFVGIVLALIMRTIFIFVGATVVNNFAWVFYIFGGFLAWTAWSQLRHARDSHEEDEYKENVLVRVTRRLFPTTDDYVDDKLVVKRNGRRLITPMLIVMIAIAGADLLFAVDSIPAIFGVTQEVFLIFSANAFALLGLRQLYFLVDGLLDKLVYLPYGLAAILAFISAKLIIHALHTNEVPFINGGQEVHAIPEVPPVLSLVVIVVILAVTTIASLLKSRSNDRRAASEGGQGRVGGPGSPSDD